MIDSREDSSNLSSLILEQEDSHKERTLKFILVLESMLMPLWQLIVLRDSNSSLLELRPIVMMLELPWITSLKILEDSL